MSPQDPKRPRPVDPNAPPGAPPTAPPPPQPVPQAPPYGAPAPYGQPAPAYGQPPGYAQPAPNPYGAPAVYGAPPAYGQPAPYMTYNAPMPYGAPPPYGAPAMYPPAYPMPYVVPFQPIPMVPGRETQAALDRLKQATFIGMAASTMTFGIGLLAVGMHATGDARPTFFTSPGFALHLIAFLLQVVAVGVAWVGLDDLKDGAREISQKHVEHFKKITNYLLFAGLTWAMGGIMAIVLGGAALLFSLPGGAANTFTTTVLVYQGIMGAIGLVMNICIALALQMALAELMQRPGRLMTQMFYIFAIGGTVASFALSMLGVVVGEPSLAPVASIMSLLALLIFLKQLDSAKAGTQSIISTPSRDPDGAAPAAPAPA